MSEERQHYRPGWDDYFMAIAKVVAARGTCDRLYSGAILVKNNRIIATGYNGSPPGLPHCQDVGHLMEEGHCVRTVHGEHNVLLQAAIQGGTSTTGSTMYTKYLPCIHCTKYVIACGVKRIVAAKIYRNPKALDMLKEAGVEVVLYQENPEWLAELQKIFSEEVPTRTNEGEVKLEAKS
ncbi:MAG: cytidine/deoxycytidylate deaminase family protein [Candidatus Liptonbacteria bacterium]|nr:cytidine/deoxycytidylate deaminase family protein [Candidatus Liptonbacteria bacterium]